MVNTGWTGGPYGEGNRIKLGYTRAMIAAALNGELDQVETKVHPVFGMKMPVRCAGVPSELLDPRKTWTDPAAYDEKADELAKRFINNFKKYEAGTPASILAAGPKLRF
jgi:phosphoenolpyruvate carboxykinase (ATP)